MKQQFLDLTGLTELVAYIESNVTDKKEILPYASNKLFPSTGDVNAIYIDTATNTIYRWDTSSKTYIILAKAVKSVSISESTENGKITLTVDGVKTTVPIHGLGSAAYTNSNAYSPADHTHTKAQIGLGSVDNTADKDKSVKHANTADSATTAGTATTATNVSAEIGQADIARHVWFSDSATETKRNYNDKFKYNPTTNTVTANISGSAASANSVLWSGVTNKPSTFTPSAHNHDDSTITSLNASKLFGTIDIARLPQGALERLVIVADDTARFKLTTANVQLGDTVKVIKTEKMYYVVDESKLSSEAGYSVYTAGTATSVPWSGVTGKPSSYPPASHNHDERYYTETEINSKLAEKAEKVHTHVKSEVGLGNVDNTADANKSVKYAASAGTATKANAVPWSGITDKPSTYPPSSHTHDDRYYTESEINANVYRLKTFDIIPANANLNTYITPGTYGQSTGSTAQTIKNLPYSNSPYEFKLIVEYYFSNSSRYIMQRLYRWNSTEYYIRESTDSGVSWLAWRKFANSDETLLRSGGTMTGALHIMQPGSGSYNENIRIHPSTAGWTSIVMCGTDNTGNSGTSARTWGLYTSEGQFAIAKNGNGLTSGTAILKCDNNNSWTINGSTILNSSNYNSYAPTKTGGGASGTWGISITGNATSATNADKLDGYHRKGLYPSIPDWINANGYTKTITVNGNANTYYPVVIGAPLNKEGLSYVSIWKNLGSKTASYSGNHSNGTSSMWIIYEGRNWYWDGNGGYAKCWYYSMPYANLCAQTDFLPNNVGSYCVYLRGGGTDYCISTTYDCTPKVYYSATNVGDSNYPVNIAPRTSVGNYGCVSSTVLGYGNIDGNASTATALTSNAGSATQPIYFSSGKPVACSYTLNKSVPSDAKFTDTNTWRPLGTGASDACAGNDSRLSNSRPASDVYAWAKASSKPSYSWGEITGKPSTFTPASHTHNYAGSSSAGGNANAAVKLATARTINGTSFNGSANITTANWGTARTITVGNTGKSVNGSGNVSWSLGEIGIHVSNKQPAASEGKNGDVWIVYEG